MKWYNFHGTLPTTIDRHHQYMYYKGNPVESLIPMLFEDDCAVPLEPGRQYFMSNDPREQQFSDYRQLRFDDLMPFVRRWFQPGVLVTNRIYDFIVKYELDYQHTLAVFHRGNDKVRETKLASDEDWIDKIRQVLDGVYIDPITKLAMDMSRSPYFIPFDKILLLPDNTEFRDKCVMEFGDKCIVIEENHLYPADNNACNFMKVPVDQRPQHALNFFASVIIASRCKSLITHSGNGGFWSVVYRGHADNITQYLNGEWI